MRTNEQDQALVKVGDDSVRVSGLMAQLNVAVGRAVNQQSLVEIGKAYDALHDAEESLNRVRAHLFLLSQTLPDTGE